jgi:hypothetical protein
MWTERRGLRPDTLVQGDVGVTPLLERFGPPRSPHLGLSRLSTPSITRDTATAP